MHDGHNHDQYSVRYHDGQQNEHVYGNNPSVIKQLHDGPGRHHHDDDGHDHHKHSANANKPEAIKANNEDNLF